MRGSAHKLFVVVSFLLAGVSVSAGVTDHAVGVNVRPSFIIPTHGFYNGWNPSGRTLRAGGTLDVQYSFSVDGSGAYQGAGAAVHTFFAHKLIGTPATIYIFQGAPLARLCDNLTFGYEWNLGLSAGWKNNGIVTVSPLNAYINVAALFTWHTGKHWEIIFGPEYTHFSNGDTMFPNGGANTLNFRIGTRYHFNPQRVIQIEKIFAGCDENRDLSRRFAYDLILSGGWRADRYMQGNTLMIDNRAFPTASVCLNPSYAFNEYLSVGPALEYMYDSSANARYAFLSHSALGISARAELRMPVFAVNIGAGYSFVMARPQKIVKPELHGLYGVFSLKAFVTSRIFLNISYRLSVVNYSHSLMYGIGYRFEKK